MHEQLAQYIRNEIPITEKDLQTVLSFFKPFSAIKNQVLLTAGDHNHRFLFVCKGCLRIYFVQEDGQEATRYLAFENHFSTALVSLISQQPSLEYIQALEPTELLSIHRDDFSALLNTIPHWERFYRQYLEKAYVTNTHRLMGFITQDAGERYHQLLEQHPQMVSRLPNRIIASYLNISQETLSRIKGKKEMARRM